MNLQIKKEILPVGYPNSCMIFNRGGRPPGMNSSTYIHEDTYYRDSLTSRRAMTNVSNLHRSPLDLSSRQKTILITIC